MRLSDALVQFVSYQYQDAIEIDPDDKNNQTTDGAIQKVIGGNI